MPSLSLQRPVVLLALAAVPVLGVLWWRACHITNAAAQALWGRNHALVNAARGLLRAGALSALVVALAGPVLRSRLPAIQRAAPVVFVLDISASMEADDTLPSRLAVAKHAIRDVCERLPFAHTALVAAATDATVVCPITADRAAFLAILDSADTSWSSATGTDLVAGVRRAAELLVRDTAGAGVVVLVSDGECRTSLSEREILELRAAGAVLHTVVAGTARGIPLSRLPIATPNQQNRTRARPQQMAHWAQVGAGRSWLAGQEPPTARDLLPESVELSVAVARGQARPVSSWLYLSAAALLALDAVLAAWRS